LWSYQLSEVARAEAQAQVNNIQRKLPRSQTKLITNHTTVNGKKTATVFPLMVPACEGEPT